MYCDRGDPFSAGADHRRTTLFLVRLVNLGAKGESGGQASVEKSTKGASRTLIRFTKALRRIQYSVPGWRSANLSKREENDDNQLIDSYGTVLRHRNGMPMFCKKKNKEMEDSSYLKVHSFPL
jgi:hypothetical protein